MKKLTEAQERIFNRMVSGRRLKVINRHHANGGTFIWDDDSHAGHVYKALFGMYRSLKLTPEQYFDQTTRTFGLHQDLIEEAQMDEWDRLS